MILEKIFGKGLLKKNVAEEAAAKAEENSKFWKEEQNSNMEPTKEIIVFFWILK